MDALSTALDLIRITAVRVGPRAGSPPSDRACHAAAFTLVTGGTHWIEIEGLLSGFPLKDGDFVLLPCASVPTILKSANAGHAPNATREPAASTGFGATTGLISGLFEFDGVLSRRFAAVLPKVIHVAGAECLKGGWIRNTLELAAEEERQPRAGSRAVVNRLCEAVFAYAVRTHLARSETRGNWLKALGDPRVGDAVSLIRSNPERRWTVQSLAARVGMSRSGFAAQFRAAVGEPPLQHLIRCRVDRACQLLTTDRVSLAEVASRVGYESDAAFSKVFKRCTGVAPGAYRTRSMPGAAGAA